MCSTAHVAFTGEPFLSSLLVSTGLLLPFCLGVVLHAARIYLNIQFIDLLESPVQLSASLRKITNCIIHSSQAAALQMRAQRHVWHKWNVGSYDVA